jgi:hypothetical protein
VDRGHYAGAKGDRVQRNLGSCLGVGDLDRTDEPHDHACIAIAIGNVCGIDRELREADNVSGVRIFRARRVGDENIDLCRRRRRGRIGICCVVRARRHAAIRWRDGRLARMIRWKPRLINLGDGMQAASDRGDLVGVEAALDKSGNLSVLDDQDRLAAARHIADPSIVGGAARGRLAPIRDDVAFGKSEHHRVRLQRSEVYPDECDGGRCGILPDGLQTSRLLRCRGAQLSVREWHEQRGLLGAKRGRDDREQQDDGQHGPAR